jgi:hypothetical protein
MGILERICPSGTAATKYALRSLANGKFVRVGAKDRLVATAAEIDSSALFDLVRIGEKFGLRSLSNDCFVSCINPKTEAAPILAASRPAAWGMDAWEMFEAREGTWPSERYGLAIAATSNGKLVCAENAAAEFLRARSEGAYGWEHFRLMPVIDMAQVLTAFADRHPGQAKACTKHSDNSGLGWVHDGLIYETRPLGSLSSRNQIAITHMSDNWMAQQDHSYVITDWYYLDNNRVGIAGTYEKKIEGHLFENYTTFGAYVGKFAQPDGKIMLKMADRYMTPDMVGLQITSDWRDWTGPKADQGGTPTICHNVVESIAERVVDAAGTKRWMMCVASDAAFPNASGHSAGFPYELCYYDLGPAEGVYDPELGFVGYKQIYADNHGIPNGLYAEEFYSKIVPGTYQRQIGSLLSV